jgi:hypothetical protein
MDYAGPLEDCMFLVVVDAHNKWLEITVMKSSSAKSYGQPSVALDYQRNSLAIMTHNWCLKSSGHSCKQMEFSTSSQRRITLQ